MMTPEREKGMQFEIWLELLLRHLGHQNVKRDVEYHKKRYVFRQVDVSYSLVKEGRIYLAIVEAKYSSNGQIPYRLRNGKIKKSTQQIPQIDNLVDEVLERQKFIGADVNLLVTNRSFEDKVKKEAERYGIRVVEDRQLTRLYRGIGGKGRIDDSIRAINIRRYNLNKNIIYL
jgi:hypothetical protein